ncbi:MAG: hypothetical protein KDD55_00120 [Bdellovibrionales bacterium]|nr:hypothetical protein [Bdellovibrionales bacterium]
MTMYHTPTSSSSPRSNERPRDDGENHSPLRELLGRFFKGFAPQPPAESPVERDRKPSPDERLSKWWRQHAYLHDNTRVERAGMTLLSRISHRVKELEQKAPVNDIEALINQRQIEIGKAIAQLELPIRNLTFSDRDQLSGMLKMVRNKEINFAEGVQKISLHGEVSPHLSKTLSILSSIHHLAMIGEAQAKGDPRLFSIPDGASLPSILYPLTKGREESPEQAFATHAVVLMRMLHPFGDLPFAKVPGRNALGFKTAKGEVHLASKNYLEVLHNDDGTASVIYHSPEHEPRTYSLGYGEQLIIGRELGISKLFGISFDQVVLKTDIPLDGESMPRAGIQLIRESKEEGGAIILIVRGCRHSISISEQYAEGDRRIRFNPHGTLNDRGMFSGGESIMGF